MRAKGQVTDQRINNQDARLDGMEIGVLDDNSEIEEILDVLSRGMRDNPLHVAAFGADPELRQQRFRLLLSALFSVKDFSHTLVTRSEDGAIVGVCGMMPPGTCLPDFGQQLRLLPTLLSINPRVAGRVMRWIGFWQKHDPKERHWHLGPLVVDTHLQGMGAGSRLMQVFCAQMDAAREDAYLETDKPENVRFYERFGFEIVGEQEVLGIPNYFMLRQAERRRG
jgi:ribosomal protein S18 acetylase RimI-like enzyme